MLLAATVVMSHLARIERTPSELVLTNGIVERRIHLDRFVTTTSIRRLDTGNEYIRSVEPEAVLKIDGKEVLLGGTTPPPNRAFLDPNWLNGLQPDPNSLRFVGLEEVPIQRPIPHPDRSISPWPPSGKAILLYFRSDTISAAVRYEVYDNLPVIGKQVEFVNRGPKTVRLDTISSEKLSIVEGESNVEAARAWRLPNLTAVTDMAFGGGTVDAGSAVHWEIDPRYQTQVSYELKTPALLNIYPPVGPGLDISPNETYKSIRSFLILHSSDEREKKTLDVRQFFRSFAPWTNQNPLILHIVSTNIEKVKAAIDQASECGFEIAILSFGSGLNMEDTSPANIQKFKALREYADSKGVRLGGYSLLASRRIDDENDVINVKTGKTGGTIFGNSPCLCSKWGLQYFENLKTFIRETGFHILEHDGNYPGDACASTNHPGHRDYQDSQWKQWKLITDFYGWCRGRDVYLNVPDMYFLAGSNKTGMGYRETNWSLPREQQHVHARQNLFDGTWDKNPSMGWMFVPLVEYQGGGAAATIEPLKEHLQDYELHLANNLGYGAQACYRGMRLYDSPETKAMVVRMVSWYKKYREILESDVIHLRRADGRRIDFILHVNPTASPSAMLMAYNPTGQRQTEVVNVPLKGSTAKVREKEGKTSTHKVKDGHIQIKLDLPAKGWSYFPIN
ncbi:MAG: alpha-galactosidase [Armatimonadetes bacterium Cent15-Ar3]|nr:MAG: alpha-galactosidase [Armatimonadetes bacterium Cent15-Ar3]